MSDTPSTPRTLRGLVADLLLEHHRDSIDGCQCGWGKDHTKLGQSHSLHVADAVLALIDKERPGVTGDDVRNVAVKFIGDDYRTLMAASALIDKENTMTDEPTEMGVAFHRAERERAQREDVERASTEASTAPDDTISVPRALVEALLDDFGNGRSRAKAEARALLDPPEPPAPQLRIVRWNENNTWSVAGMPNEMPFWRALEEQPDMLTALDDAIDGYEALVAKGGHDDLKARICAALGVDS